MDRTRFEHLLEAYGGDFGRWPQAERAAGEAFARAHATELAAAISEARALDAALGAGNDSPSPSAALSAAILAAAPKARRALSRNLAPTAGWALAACAILGVVLGYGAGAMAQPSDDGSYFAAAFEAPPEAPAPGDEG